MKSTLRILILILGLSIFNSNAINTNDDFRILELSEEIEPDYQVAVKFMNEYVDFLNNQNFEIELIQWINNRQDVSNEFKAELKRIILEAEKKDPELGLGFDPILDGHDYPEKFEIEKKDSEFIILKGVDWAEFKLTLKLKNIGNKWLIDGSGIINIPKQKRINR